MKLKKSHNNWNEGYELTYENGHFLSCDQSSHMTRLILGLHPANDRRRYKVTPFLIGWVQT